MLQNTEYNIFHQGNRDTKDSYLFASDYSQVRAILYYFITLPENTSDRLKNKIGVGTDIVKGKLFIKLCQL